MNINEFIFIFIFNETSSGLIQSPKIEVILYMGRIVPTLTAVYVITHPVELSLKKSDESKPLQRLLSRGQNLPDPYHLDKKEKEEPSLWLDREERRKDRKTERKAKKE